MEYFVNISNGNQTEYLYYGMSGKKAEDVRQIALTVLRVSKASARLAYKTEECEGSMSYTAGE
jgi:hypothetical protein